MSSYNAVNKVPTSASEFYLDTLARRTYGMKGYVTGDCAAIEDIYTGHYYRQTAEEATAEGLKAGVDSDCGSVYQRYAISALEKGLITMADIDRALVNMFTIRMRTGEFDPESKVPYTKYPTSMVNSPANQALAAELSEKTPVLLKNDKMDGKSHPILPLRADELHSIAFIGPQADDVELGPYSGRPEQSVMISPYKAMKSYIESNHLPITLSLANGANIRSKSNLLYIGYFELKKSDGTTRRYDATKFSSSSEGITVGSGMGDEEQVRSIDDGSWTAYDNIDLTDVESITVSVNIPTEGGIVEARVSSPEGNLIATIDATAASGARVGGVYGQTSPMEAKVLRLGLNEAQTLYLVYKAPTDAPIDEETISVARNADVAVVFVGTDEHTATEEADRLTLLLPGNQLDLIKAVSAVNRNTIVVMQTLGCVEVEEFKDLPSIPGILWTGYNGEAQGTGITHILFGEATPGGKLNATWFKTVHDLPHITNYHLRGGEGFNGRTLWYFNKAVSYEFGYGLSYTTFEYSNFTVSKSRITPDDKIVISVDVTNTGSYDGDEVVQVYMTTPDSPASLQRPIKRLKGFKRVTVPRSQTKTVEIPIDCSDLWFWNMEGERMTYDQGRYVFEIGSSSKDIRGSVTSVMSGSLSPRVKTVVADCGVSVLRGGESAKVRVTAAMNDDSFYDIGKAQVTYVSNNPSVASVSPDGKILAKSMGVATITAKVTINGETKSDDFALKVMPDLSLATLTVDGKSILKDGVSQYCFVKPLGAKAPIVDATSVDPSISVDITQAAGVPGTAVVTLTDYVTLDRKTVTVNFGPKAISDEFSSLGSQWKWLREDPKGWSLTENPGQLTLTAGEGDILGEKNKAGNILLQDANTDWVADTKVRFSATPSMPSQNAGILSYQDDGNFVKFVYGAPAMGRGRRQMGGPGTLQLVIEENGNSKQPISFSMEGIIKEDNTLYLRLEKKGEHYTGYYSLDGKKYVKAVEGDSVLKDIKAGLITCNGELPAMFARFMQMGRQAAGAPEVPSAPFKATFDFFRIKSTSSK